MWLEQSRWPVITTDEFHIRKADELIKGNWQITWREIAVKLGISTGACGSHYLIFFDIGNILQDGLLVCWQQKWKLKKLNICQPLSCFENEDVEFHHNIMTFDERQAHHYVWERKYRSMEYQHKASLGECGKHTEKSDFMTSLHIYDHCSIPGLLWLLFVTFTAGFHQAKSMEKSSFA